MSIAEEDRDILEAVISALNAEHEHHKNGIVDGNPQTFDEYRLQVGICAGLRLAADVIRDTAKNWGKESDDHDRD